MTKEKNKTIVTDKLGNIVIIGGGGGGGSVSGNSGGGMGGSTSYPIIIGKPCRGCKKSLVEGNCTNENCLWDK